MNAKWCSFALLGGNSRAMPVFDHCPRRGTTIMNAPSFTRAVLAIALGLAVSPTVSSQAAQTNVSVFAGFPWAENVNREVDLARSLLAETNRSFDQKVYDSVRTNAHDPLVISFHLVSFIFYYPTGVAFLGSVTQMGQPDELVCTKDGILRRATTNEISANYVRVLDAHRKSVGADLDLFLGVAPLGKPQEAKYFRRSFRFVYQNGWKED